MFPGNVLARLWGQSRPGRGAPAIRHFFVVNRTLDFEPMSSWRSRWTARALLGATLALATGTSALAQTGAYPNRPIRLVVGYAAGGSTDILARALSERLSKSLDQPVVVDNQPGSAGLLGVEAVARAAPDGYTIGLGTATNLAIRPAIHASLPYDPRKDLKPISLIASVPNVMLVTSGLPVKSVADLVEYAKAKPGVIVFASTGTGNSSHLTAELFRMLTGIEAGLTPYRGSAAAIGDLMNGQVQVVFDNMRAAIPYVRSNNVRALAVTGSARSPWIPELPTMAEAGVAGCELTAWYGVFGPTGLPQVLVARLYEDIFRAMGAPEVKALLIQLGAEAVITTPSEFAQRIDLEMKKWGKVARAAGITLN